MNQTPFSPTHAGIGNRTPPTPGPTQDSMKGTVIGTFQSLRRQPSQLGQDISQAFGILANSTTLPLSVSNTYGHPIPNSLDRTHREHPTTGATTDTHTTIQPTPPTATLPDTHEPSPPANDIPTGITRHINLTPAATENPPDHYKRPDQPDTAPDTGEAGHTNNKDTNHHTISVFQALHADPKANTPSDDEGATASIPTTPTQGHEPTAPTYHPEVAILSTTPVHMITT